MAFLNPSSILCKYFAAGSCKRTDCYYSHDAKTSQPGNICRYFALGICFYGDECRFDHVPVEVSETTDTSDVTVPSLTVLSEPPPLLPVTVSVPPPREPRTRSETAAATKSAKIVKNTESNAGRKNQKKSAKRLHVESDEGTTSPVGTATVTAKKSVRLPPLCPIGRSRPSCGLIDCPFRHGDFCDICQCQALDPHDLVQRKDHEKECTAIFEKEMNTTFAVQKSLELQCNVCLDIVRKQVDKTKRRFGVLEGCQHVFCFSCIMLWRKQPTEESEAIQRNRTCPTCRTHSHFVFPTEIWPDTKLDKETFIADFKKTLAKKPCLKYNHGKGKCLFGSKCWYLHTKADGTVVQLPPPTARRCTRADSPDDFDAWDLFGADDDDDDDDMSDNDSYLEMDQDDQLYLDMVDYADQLAQADLHNLFGVGVAALPTEDDIAEEEDAEA